MKTVHAGWLARSILAGAAVAAVPFSGALAQGRVAPPAGGPSHPVQPSPAQVGTARSPNLPPPPTLAFSIQGAQDKGTHLGETILHGLLVYGSGQPPQASCSIAFFVDDGTRAACTSVCGTPCKTSAPSISPGHHVVTLTSKSPEAHGSGTVDVDRASPVISVLPAPGGPAPFWTMARLEFDGQPLPYPFATQGVKFVINGIPLAPSPKSDGPIPGPGWTASVPMPIAGSKTKVDVTFAGNERYMPASATVEYDFKQVVDTVVTPIAPQGGVVVGVTVKGGQDLPTPTALTLQATVGSILIPGAPPVPTPGANVRFFVCLPGDCSTSIGSGVTNGAGVATVTTDKLNWHNFFLYSQSLSKSVHKVEVRAVFEGNATRRASTGWTRFETLF